MNDETQRPIRRPPWLSDHAWPFGIETLVHDGARLAVTDVAGDGPPLLLVHSGLWSFVWRDLIGPLSRHHRVIAFDPPAMGLSDEGAGAGLGPTAAAVDAMVRRLDLRDLTLVAHDLGGPAAIEALNRWPERVTGFVAVNTFGWRPAGTLFRSMLSLMGSRIARELDASTGWLPLATATRFGVGRHLSRAERAVFRAGMDRRGRRSFHQNVRSALDHDYALVDRGTRALRDLPLLTVFGERNDPLGFQVRWRELAERVDQVVVPGGNHFPMCDDAQLVADAIVGWRARLADADVGRVAEHG